MKFYNVAIAGALTLAVIAGAHAGDARKLVSGKSAAFHKAREDCLKENSKLAGKDLRECIKKRSSPTS